MMAVLSTSAARRRRSAVTKRTLHLLKELFSECAIDGDAEFFQDCVEGISAEEVQECDDDVLQYGHGLVNVADFGVKDAALQTMALPLERRAAL